MVTLNNFKLLHEIVNNNCKIGRAQTYTLVKIVGSKIFSGYLFCSDRSRTKKRGCRNKNSRNL